ncbi:hypothetical protein [Dermatobacter hominis]|uniref:hypothetical protein n=1 Tax=Dermatobacter hominis TaxID=2884263 RepID=UPI001D101CD2|nr:hypothetical protein [Dermatobacter hominis]UDY35889.1 hypothetical protein LH044_21545 [Dermatobacter hominis]
MTAADLRREVDGELALLAAASRSVAGDATYRSAVEVALLLPPPATLGERSAWMSRCVVTWALLDHLPAHDRHDAVPDPVATAAVAALVDDVIVRLRELVRARLAETRSIVCAGLFERAPWDESDESRDPALDSLVVMIAMTDRHLLVD